ncbi:MAG: metallophosphoesterase [Anaerolineae bacterium]|nr:metallophosphoesterase [Anaerolineae bacterium]
MTRPLYLCATAAAVGALALGGGRLTTYAAAVEPHRAEVVRLALPLPRLPRSLDRLTIAQISDLHVGYAMNDAQLAHDLSTVNALEPDLIVITGDMFHSHPSDAERCARSLSELRAPHGVYAIMGNHERRLPPAEGEEPFRRAGLHVLANASHRVAVNGAALWLIGLDDVIMRRGDLARALQGVPENACKVLLVHEPDFAERAAQRSIDLQLSGHTHGGQIRLPLVGPLLLPVLGRRYPMGLYRVHDTWLYTNRGLGVNRPALRLNCRPEITLFTLHAATEA